MNYHVEALSRSLRQELPLIAGVLNTTPNSFSDGGLFQTSESAISHGRSLIKDGATLLDIGGESTGPGTNPVSPEDEWQRLEPAVRFLSTEHIVSVDTYKSSIAKRALELGAAVVNDVSGLRADANMASIIAEHQAYVVIMHSKEVDTHPHATSSKPNYKDVVEVIATFLEQQIDYAQKEGISKERIIIDPGMGGFLSTDAEVSWEVIRRLNELATHFSDYPLLIGASRKGFLGGDIQQRDPLSQLVHLKAAQLGAKILRTHNVKMAASFLHCWKRLS